VQLLLVIPALPPTIVSRRACSPYVLRRVHSTGWMADYTRTAHDERAGVRRAASAGPFGSGYAVMRAGGPLTGLFGCRGPALASCLIHVDMCRRPSPRGRAVCSKPGRRQSSTGLNIREPRVQQSGTRLAVLVPPGGSAFGARRHGYRGQQGRDGPTTMPSPCLKSGGHAPGHYWCPSARLYVLDSRADQAAAVGLDAG